MSVYDPHKHCRHELLAVHPYQPGKSIAMLQAKYDLQLTQIIKLASNENLAGPSPEAIKVIQQHADQVMMYPEGLDVHLTERIAAHHGVQPECVVLGNGSNEILELLGHAFLHQADAQVGFSEHAFMVYGLVAQLCAAEIKCSAAQAPSSSMPYGHDLAQLHKIISEKTRLLFIANPNNPTGTWLTRIEIAEFLECVPDSCLVVIDQAYIEYAEEGIDALPLLQLFSNLVITQTFSKAYGLAGLRIGYSMSSPAIAQLLNSIRQPFNVNLLAQKAALSSLEDQEYLRQSVESNRAGLHQVQTFLRQHNIPFLPSQTNFLSVHVGPNSLKLYQNLLREGIIVRPIANYGLPEYLRITIGQTQHNERLIAALHKFLKRS